MALTVTSVVEERATNRCRLIKTLKEKKPKLLKTMTFLKDLAYFSENGVKNDYSILKQMKKSLRMTSKFRTNKNDV